MLSVVIVHYNTPDDLRRCLDSLVVTALDLEIIVVENDASAAPLHDSFPDVRWLSQPENRWFCGGNNVGIAAATRPYVLLLNPDTVVNRAALAALLDFITTHEDYAGATVQMRYPDGSIQRTCSRIPTPAYLLAVNTPLGLILPGWRSRLQTRHWYADWDRTTSRDVEVLPGSCLLMRRADLWLDDNLLLYFPEDDIARRFAGARFRFLAEVSIMHREKAATQSWLATRVYFRDLLVYARKHHGAAFGVLLWLLTRPLLAAMAVKRWLA